MDQRMLDDNRQLRGSKPIYTKIAFHPCGLNLLRPLVVVGGGGGVVCVVWSSSQTAAMVSALYWYDLPTSSSILIVM